MFVLADRSLPFFTSCLSVCLTVYALNHKHPHTRSIPSHPRPPVGKREGRKQLQCQQRATGINNNTQATWYQRQLYLFFCCKRELLEQQRPPTNNNSPSLLPSHPLPPLLNTIFFKRATTQPNPSKKKRHAHTLPFDPSKQVIALNPAGTTSLHSLKPNKQQQCNSYIDCQQTTVTTTICLPDTYTQTLIADTDMNHVLICLSLLPSLHRTFFVQFPLSTFLLFFTLFPFPSFPSFPSFLPFCFPPLPFPPLLIFSQPT